MNRTSMKVAITVPLLIALVIGIGAMVTTTGVLSTNMASDLTASLIKADIELAVEMIDAYVNEAIGGIQVLAPVVAGVSDSTESYPDPREYVTQLFTRVLDYNDSWLAIWTCWEPNAFDGNDGALGPFDPCVFRSRGNSIAVEPLVGYDDPVDGAYYQVAKNTGRPFFTEPYYYVYGDVEHLVLTYSYPIIRNGSVVGVIGADMSLNNLVEIINRIEILDDGYVFVLSPDGSYAAHPERTTVMKHYSSGWMGNYRDEIEGIFSRGGDFTTVAYSDVLRTNVRFNGTGLELGGRHWLVGATVSVQAEQAASNRMLFVTIAIGVAMLIFVSLVAYVIINSRAKHLPKLTDAAEAIALGDIKVDLPDTGTAPTNNEITRLERAFVHMQESFKKQAFVLARIAEGDYTSRVEIRSKKDVINYAIQLVVNETLSVLNQVASAGIQVSQASSQIAEGAQSLAQGATEQAATVEELSASMSEIAEKTKENASKADSAAQLADNIKNSAEKGSHQMGAMIDAVNEISKASKDINSVIKVIDDIAFQTNILALNAAVEAARAGQHGKGFAVVAEEVRNLASKSAEAAKDTGEMITNSIEKAELGSRIAHETAASLDEIVEGIKQSTEIVSNIAQSCIDEAENIVEIHKGVEQVAQVVHQNSATAEQSAAASQQMSAQSAMLEDLIMQFNLVEKQKALEAGNYGNDALSTIDKDELLGGQ